MATPGLFARIVSGFSAAAFNDAGVPFQYARDRVDLLRSAEFSYGTGAGQATMLYHVGGSLANPADSASYNLANGSLFDGIGRAIEFSRVRALGLFSLARPETANAPIIRLSGTNGAAALNSGYIEIGGGGSILHVAPDATGWPVAGGMTTITVSFTSGTGPAEYALAVIGS